MKALGILKIFKDREESDGDTPFCGWDYDEAIAEIEALQEHKTCNGCVHVGDNDECFGCLRAGHNNDYYEPKDKQ